MRRLMIIRKWASAFGLLIAVCHVTAQVSHNIENARRTMQEAYATQGFPGAAVAVWQDGDLLWSEGYGSADVGRGIPVDPARSLFRIGSVSKSLTAMALAVLAERDVIDIDLPVHAYVPGFPKKQWPLTTRQAAQHIAGIRHYLGLEFLSNIYYESVTDALEIFKYDTLLFEPGTQYSYSTYGWTVVSAAMENAAGIPFLQLMRDLVFDPLRMHNTFPDDVRKDLSDRVEFYYEDDGINVLAPQVDNSLKWAGGGFLSTAEDLIRFGIGVLRHELCSDSTKAIFWSPAILSDGSATNYGIGWSTGFHSINDNRDTRWVGHSGTSVGGSAMLLIYPDDDLIVVTLVNRSPPQQREARELAFQIAGYFIH